MVYACGKLEGESLSVKPYINSFIKPLERLNGLNFYVYSKKKKKKSEGEVETGTSRPYELTCVFYTSLMYLFPRYYTSVQYGYEELYVTELVLTKHKSYKKINVEKTLWIVDSVLRVFASSRSIKGPLSTVDTYIIVLVFNSCLSVRTLSL